jgi:hypothetical protein
MLMNYLIKNYAAIVSTVGIVYEEILFYVSIVLIMSDVAILFHSSNFEFSIST